MWITRGGFSPSWLPIAQAAAVAAAEGRAGAEPVPLRYALSEDLAKVLQPFVGADGKIAADPGRNILLVSGTPETRESMISLIHMFPITLTLAWCLVAAVHV